MATVNLKGTPCRISGALPAVGSKAPDFRLVAGDLGERTLSDYAGARKVVNIVPSLDTPVCAQQTRHFNEVAASLDNTRVLVISPDLPFAQERFCETNGIENVEALSGMRSPEFGQDWGVMIEEGSFAGVYARAVVVLDENDQVIHSQLVPEIGEEPDYDAALATLK